MIDDTKEKNKLKWDLISMIVKNKYNDDLKLIAQLLDNNKIKLSIKESRNSFLNSNQYSTLESLLYAEFQAHWLMMRGKNQEIIIKFVFTNEHLNSIFFKTGLIEHSYLEDVKPQLNELNRQVVKYIETEDVFEYRSKICLNPSFFSKNLTYIIFNNLRMIADFPRKKFTEEEFLYFTKLTQSIHQYLIKEIKK